MLKLSKNAIAMLVSKYLSVLKKMRLKGAVLLAVCCLTTASPALAQTIVYDDAAAVTLGVLQPTPSGGFTDSFFPTSSASGNTVIVNYINTGGANTPKFVFGGFSSTGDASRNSVLILSGDVSDNVYGGYGGVTNYNTVTISGSGNVAGNVYGGVGGSVGGSVGDANYNIVTISGGGNVDGNVYGGVVGVGGGVANYNTVTISGGTVTGNVYGGDGDSSANYNTVTISGGTVTGSVYGGYGGSSGNYNTVTISGSAVLSSTSTNLRGGGGGSDNFTGNTLNLNGFSGAVAAVSNFQYYNFTLSSGAAGGYTALTVGGTANLTGSGTASSSVQSVNFLGGGRLQQAGEVFTLIGANALTTNGNLNTTVQGQKGFSLLYNFDLAASPTALTATITSSSLMPQTKAFAEGKSAGFALLRQGSDLAAGDGLKNAWKEAASTPGHASFSALEAGSSRYKTGSHVDVHGVSLLTGVASHRQTDNGALMSGVFLEAGWGGYDSYNSFTNLPSVKGDGNVNYYGLGFLARSERKSGTYSEGSLRLGRTKVDFSSDDMSFLGQNASYDSSSGYWGAHFGVGKIKTSGQRTLDVYGKYLFTHQGGDDVSVGGDPLSFSGSDSHRLKAGFRLSRENNERVTTYAGAAYEYEFDGKSKATVYGLDIDAPSVRGSTGVLELGAKWKKSSADTLEAALLGYVGKRQGVSGTLQFKHMF